MTLLVVFARQAPDLAFTRQAMLDASRVAAKEKRYSSDGFARGWRNWYDDAAKLFRKQYGWTPLAKARERAAEAEAHNIRYLMEV
jgi:hypothetical protein